MPKQVNSSRLQSASAFAEVPLHSGGKSCGLCQPRMLALHEVISTEDKNSICLRPPPAHFVGHTISTAGGGRPQAHRMKSTWHHGTQEGLNTC